MKKIISAAALALLVFGCLPQNQASNDPRSAGELEGEVLKRAADCGREIERDYEEAIERNKRKYTEEKMKAWLVQVIEKGIKC